MQVDIRDMGQVCSLGWEDSLKEGMAAHSSILAWRIPWTEEPGGLQSIGLHRPSDTTKATQQQHNYGSPRERAQREEEGVQSEHWNPLTFRGAS